MVCTGNVCRSPLAEQVLRVRLAPLGPIVTSAGTHGLNAAPMTPEAVRLAGRFGVPAVDSAAHRSRFLTAAHLASPDLIITMTRAHRRHVAELAPARLRSTFTAREFARLAVEVPDDEIRAAADAAAVQTPGARVRAVAALLASRRGMSVQPAAPEDDDVIDPFRRAWETYELSGAQLAPALDQIARVLRRAAKRAGEDAPDDDAPGHAPVIAA